MANTESVALKASGATSSKKRRKLTHSTDSLHSATYRRLPWTYLRLSLLGADAKSIQPVDEISARSHLTSAFSQFLGLSGTAVVADILKADGSDVWIRVPREDSKAVIEGLSGWTGGGNAHAWLIQARGEWLAALKFGESRDLFD